METEKNERLNLTFIGPCIANIFAEYNQQDVTFLSLFISVRRSTCFRRVFRPSSGAQNCTYSVRYLSHRYCYLLLAWVFVRPILLPAASQSICQTNTATCCLLGYLSDQYCYLLPARVFVRPILLPAASHGICQTDTATCC